MAKPELQLTPKHRPEVKDMLDKMLLHIPGVTGSKAFGYPAYQINGKVFTFVGEKGVGVKLSSARVRQLIESGGMMRPFEVANGVVWKEWVYLELDTVEMYRNYSGLFDEAIQRVAGTS